MRDLLPSGPLTAIGHNPITVQIVSLTLKSSPFYVSRIVLARLALIQYVKRFWWFASIIPTFGLILLCVGTGVMQLIGAIAVLWPFSLPARSVLSSNRAAKFLTRGVWVLLENEVLYFHGENQKGFKLELASVYRVDRIGDYLNLTIRGRNAGLPDFMFVPLDLTAFGDEATELEQLIRSKSILERADD